MGSGSTMSINPDIDEAFVLRGWYDSSGAAQSFQAHSNATPGGTGGAFNRNDIMSIVDVKSAKLGENPDQADSFCARGTIMHIKSDNIAYPACPGRSGQGCGKKVVQGGEGWRCEKCDITHDKPEYR
jgi:replication factor A1